MTEIIKCKEIEINENYNPNLFHHNRCKKYLINLKLIFFYLHNQVKPFKLNLTIYIIYLILLKKLQKIINNARLKSKLILF